MAAFPDAVLRGWLEELAETGEVRGREGHRWHRDNSPISCPQQAAEWALNRIDELERDAN